MQLICRVCARLSAAVPARALVSNFAKSFSFDDRTQTAYLLALALLQGDRTDRVLAIHMMAVVNEAVARLLESSRYYRCDLQLFV